MSFTVAQFSHMGNPPWIQIVSCESHARVPDCFVTPSSSIKSIRKIVASSLRGPRFWMFLELQKSDVWAGKSPSSSIKSMKSDRDLPKSSLFTCFNHKPIINSSRHFCRCFHHLPTIRVPSPPVALRRRQPPRSVPWPAAASWADPGASSAPAEPVDLVDHQYR